MGTATQQKLATASGVDTGALARILQEGYGPGAWHGADMKAALADVTPELAFWRPGAERHNIAEIAVHHAYTVRSVREKLAGEPAEAFPLKGEDWFPLSNGKPLTWKQVQELLESQQDQLAGTVRKLSAARIRKLPEDVKPFDLVLGITSHAIYHAGQVQLIKRLRSS